MFNSFHLCHHFNQSIKQSINSTVFLYRFSTISTHHFIRNVTKLVLAANRTILICIGTGRLTCLRYIQGKLWDADAPAQGKGVLGSAPPQMMAQIQAAQGSLGYQEWGQDREQVQDLDPTSHLLLYPQSCPPPALSLSPLGELSQHKPSFSQFPRWPISHESGPKVIYGTFAALPCQGKELAPAQTLLRTEPMIILIIYPVFLFLIHYILVSFLSFRYFVILFKG